MSHHSGENSVRFNYMNIGCKDCGEKMPRATKYDNCRKCREVTCEVCSKTYTPRIEGNPRCHYCGKNRRK